MSFIPEGFGQGTWEFDIAGPGGPAMVVMGFEDSPGNNPDAIAATLGAAWTASGSLREGQDTSCILREVRVLIRRGGDLLPGVAAVNTAGALSGDAAPPQVSFLFQKLTGIAGRNRRGRMYLPGSPDPEEDGVYPGATVTLMDGRAEDFRQQLITDGIPIHILHVDSEDTPTPVIEFRGQAVCATQRRRVR